MIPNLFKAALLRDERVFGLWCTLSSPFATEVVAGSGYDWLLLDTEHSPGDPLTVLPQLQVIAGYPSVSAVVRPAANDTVLIKRFLDLGAQSLLVPYVNTPAEAEAAVRATRYPPHGIRGVSALTRATHFGRMPGYFDRASDEICLILQIETREALDNLEAIAAVPGVDALFIGPADLAASLGYGANQQDPALRATVADAIRRIKAARKPAGLLTGDTVLQGMAVEAGVNFLALGVDAGILARSSEAVLKTARPPKP
ncbi:HpcH/HpaI aldolase family protein [Neotabrizicola shimadae]|uniref:Hydroxypyruvate/pyruvate aldolase n=1 Tax=Neotabrizicola shimadae TaxID=2807096 RepID=A0A8G0ZX12_9RHOB|nr:aldolase/citrate lyase family protein [Neotabrizicola shimadae]QYZ69594.1 4-hydroxy-2-oxo-heptane-1,7-dioate aldolase [Neotabrizicola shimadae]